MRRSIVIGISAGLCLMGAIAGLAVAQRVMARRHRDGLEATCEEVARLVTAQKLTPGKYPDYQAPASISRPPDSQFNVVVTRPGEIFVLLKTHVGWKGNYDGVLYSTVPLRSDEILRDAYGRQQVNLPGIDGNPPVIKDRLSLHLLRVYFDLG